MKTKSFISAVILIFSGLIFTSSGYNGGEGVASAGEIVYVKNQRGPILGYSTVSGVKIIKQGAFSFKDLNRNGKLDAYEDWRLPAEKRAADLAKKMSVEQIAGLMLYSAHQAIPASGGSMFRGTYKGTTFDKSGLKPSDLSDQQIEFLSKDNLRHVLITTVESPGVAAQWNNNAQALVEGIGLGIPVNSSSDPRHGSDSYAEYNAGAGGKISMWPGTVGISASFDSELMRKFGQIAAKEYRALGIATALSPQIDLGTEPRWSRFDGTMGEDPMLAADMARAYVDGFQTSEGEYEIKDGWGYNSVNAMVKHWPGGGPEEGGRDAHYGYGAYSVYPGNNLKDHLAPFTEGAFKLAGKTSKASAVMPYYTISYGRDTVFNEKVGNSYNKYIITDLLRKKYNYDGVICTDWMITKDVSSVYAFEGKSWGVELLKEPQRIYKALIAGVDQLGGNNEMAPVIEAYKMGVAEYGEKFMRERFEKSAVRLLMNIFRVGLFENPYLVVSETEKIVGNPDFMKEGYVAQVKSVVMLKNSSKTLPVKEKLNVYIPKKHIPGGKNWFGVETQERWADAVNTKVISKFYNVVDSPDKADFAIVYIESPKSGGGYSPEDAKNGGNGYLPISLQYSPYKANFAREVSIAGGSPFESFTNRTYKGKSVTTSNVNDMIAVLETKAKMGKKPVITVVKVSNPMVFGEIEKSSDAILVHFGVQDQVIMELISGRMEPSALLPFQMPADMKTVEEQFEDVPRDMKCYIDSDGNVYDFAFGLNWKGVINDSRVRKYR